jgi:hypothetical protein
LFFFLGIKHAISYAMHAAQPVAHLEDFMSTTFHSKTAVKVIDNRTDAVKAALNPGPEARALGLVQTTIAMAQAQANNWLQVVAKLIGFDHDARKHYRAGLEQHKRDMRAHVDAAGKPAAMVAACNSAIVRFSQLKQLALALDGGMALPCRADEGTKDGFARHPQTGDVIVTMPFDSCVATARLFLKAAAAGDGKEGTKAGRTADTFGDKLKKFIERECKNPADDLPVAATVLKHFVDAFKAQAKAK